VDHQRPLAARAAFRLALVAVGAERRVDRHGQQVKVELGRPGFWSHGGRLLARLLLDRRLDRILRRAACKQRARGRDENEFRKM
jgi:hypothetical protein